MVAKPDNVREYLTAAEERRQLLLRVPESMQKRLKHLAVDRDTSVNELVVDVLSKWLEDAEERRRPSSSRRRSATAAAKR